MEALVEAIRPRQGMLFIGAGVSRNLNLPFREELIREIAIELGYDPEVFAKTQGPSREARARCELRSPLSAKSPSRAP